MAEGTFDMLNAALFRQLERLSEAQGEDLEGEIERSRAVSQLAGNVIANANTAISLLRFQDSVGVDVAQLVASSPKMLGGN